MAKNQAEIIGVSGTQYARAKPEIGNSSHLYNKSALHLVRVLAKYGREKFVGYGFNGGTAATRDQSLFPQYVDRFRSALVGKQLIVDGESRRELRYPDPVAELASNAKMFGPGGYHTQVLAAINQACWDIRGQIEGKSIGQLLGGGKRKKVPAYIAGGYYGEGKGMDELRAEMRRNVHEFHAGAVKMKIGDPKYGLKTDIKRIEAVRDEIGPDIRLMVDANCAYTVKQAKEILSALNHNGVYWFEEPVGSQDYRGHAEIREAANKKNVLIATGENGYNIHHFRTLMDYDAADVFNLDVAIMPGYDAVMQVIKEARARGIKICPHGAQELHIHLADWIEMLEYYPLAVDPFRAQLFNEQMTLNTDGTITVPTRPGLGFTPNLEFLQKDYKKK